MPIGTTISPIASFVSLLSCPATLNAIPKTKTIIKHNTVTLILYILPLLIKKQ
jgi:hypothetical protein